MKISEISAMIEEDLKKVETTLYTTIDSKIPLVNETVTYTIKNGGKRLRPIFHLLSAKMCNYDGPLSIRICSIIEHIHTATLLHDDVIDDAKSRRGKPSVNSKYGRDLAILCGDFMYSRSYMELSLHTCKEVQTIIAGAATIMSEGEVFQLQKIADTNISIDDYLKIVFSKTAVLFSAACETAGVISNAGAEKQKMLAEYGKNIGIAYQMQDDLLDYFGNTEKTGKKIGVDLAEGKITLPIILLRDNLNDDEKKQFDDLFLSDISINEKLENILTLMKKHNINDKATKMIREYTNSAKENLSVFDDSRYKNAMLSVINELIARES